MISEQRPVPSVRVDTKRANKETAPRDQNHPVEQRPARFLNYAPLKALRSRILDEVFQAELIPHPENTGTHPTRT